MSYDCLSEIFNNPRFSMFVADHLPELKQEESFEFCDLLHSTPVMMNYHQPMPTFSIPSTPTFAFGDTFSSFDQACHEVNPTESLIFCSNSAGFNENAYSEYSTPSPTYSEYLNYDSYRDSSPLSSDNAAPIVNTPSAPVQQSLPSAPKQTPTSPSPAAQKKKPTIQKPISAIKKDKDSSDESYAKRKRKQAIVWTKELHNEFTKAVAQLGETARPKAILENMKTLNPNIVLSRDMVASHLQRFRKGFVKPTSLPVQAIANPS